MFDWIGDAIDWIGDGISSLWNNTIGNVTDAIGDWIWEAMFEWLFNLIYGAIADLFEFINTTTSDIFELSWVQAFISLFHSVPDAAVNNAYAKSNARGRHFARSWY